MTLLNGRLPASTLVTVTKTGEQLTTPTANALDRLQAAAERAGVTVHVLRWGAYRPVALQQSMRLDPGAFNVSPGVVQRPAGQSTHGFGTAADMIATSTKKGNICAQKWLRANAPKFGFRQTITGDVNHFQHDGTTAITRTVSRTEAHSIIKHHWIALLGRKPSALTLARFAPSIMRDVDGGTHKLRVYIKGTSAFKRSDVHK